MVGTKKDTATFEDVLSTESSYMGNLPRFKITMPGNRPPTALELQEMYGISLERATELLKSMER